MDLNTIQNIFGMPINTKRIYFYAFENTLKKTF